MFDQYMIEEQARINHKERLKAAEQARKPQRVRKATLPVAVALVTFLRGY